MTFRRPRPADRKDIDSLVDDSLLIDNDNPVTHDKSQRALVAECDGKIVGYVSALKPDRATARRKTLAVRHFALRQSLHESNIAARMLKALLDRHGEQSMRYVETPIESFDDAPQSLLHAIVKRLKTRFRYVFPKRKGGEQEKPVVCRIGPVKA